MYITYETVQVKQQKLIDAIRDDEFIQVAKKYVMISLQFYNKLAVILWLILAFIFSVLMLASERLFETISTKLNAIYLRTDKNTGINSTTLSPIFESSVPVSIEQLNEFNTDTDVINNAHHTCSSAKSLDEVDLPEFTEKIEMYLKIAFEQEDMVVLKNIVDYVAQSVGDLPDLEVLQKAKQILAPSS